MMLIDYFIQQQYIHFVISDEIVKFVVELFLYRILLLDPYRIIYKRKIPPLYVGGGYRIE